MSTKIYNGYRFKEPVTLQQVQSFTQRLREKLAPLAKQEYCKAIIREIVEMIDMNQYGYFTTCHYFHKFEKSSLFRASCRYYDERISLLKSKNKRDPDVDFDFSICIIPLQSKDSTLILLYTEQSFLRKAFVEFPEIEEYHYQNQSDKPDEITEADWDIRRKDWDEGLGDFAPIEVGLEYRPYSFDRFNFYTFHETKEYLENHANEVIPLLDDRARLIAKRIMAEEWDVKHPLTELPENPTKEQKAAQNNEAKERFWKYMDYLQTDDAIKWRLEKSEEIKKELLVFNTLNDLYDAKIDKFHDKIEEVLAKDDGGKPYWMDK